MIGKTTNIPETQQKVWENSKCYVKYTYYANPHSTDNFGDGVPELRIEWKEVPTKITPTKSTPTLTYIGKYASEYWEDTGEMYTKDNKRHL